MRATAHRLLNLVLALTGLLAAAVAAHSSAAHGGSLIWQTVLGTVAYAAATGTIGRLLLAAHPADAIADSITTLAGVAAALLALAASVLTGIGTLFASADDAAPGIPESAPDAYAKTA